MLSVLSALPGVNPDFFNLPFVLQLIVIGLTNGSIYALMAITVVMIYKTTGHVNFAQGEMATMGAFILFTASVDHGLPYWASVPMVICIAMLGGAAVERGLVRRVERRSNLAVIITTLGLLLILNSLTTVIWGVDPVQAPSVFPNGLRDQFVLMDGPPRVFVRYAALGTWIVLIGVVTLLHLMLRRTALGVAYRAVAADRSSAELVGVPVERLLMFGWALSAAIGTTAAILLAGKASSLDFTLMSTALIYGFASAALGGFDSIGGAVVGGITVGLAESLVPQFFSFIGSELSLVMALLIIVVVLTFRPDGMFGTKRVVRV